MLIYGALFIYCLLFNWMSADCVSCAPQLWQRSTQVGGSVIRERVFYFFPLYLPMSNT